MRILRAVPLVLGALAATLAAGRLAHAQANGSVGFSALVEAQTTGQGVRDLDFGRIVPGATQAVAPDNTASCVGCTSALFTFLDLLQGNQAARRFARLEFTLPAQLTHAQGFTLSPTWTNAARACLEKGGAEYFCYAAWTPVTGTFQSLQINGAGSPGTPPGPGTRNMNVYLGGSLAVPASQPAGVYLGTVTLTFTYAST